MYMPNLKFLAPTDPEIWRGSQNFKSRSRDPFPTPFDLILHFYVTFKRSIFFYERVVNVWNSSPDDVCFNSFYRFRCSIMRITLSSHLRYCVMLRLFLFSFIYFMRVINIVKLIRATVSVFFVPCCPVLLSFYLVLSYTFELNKWRWRWRSWVINMLAKCEVSSSNRSRDMEGSHNFRSSHVTPSRPPLT